MERKPGDSNEAHCCVYKARTPTTIPMQTFSLRKTIAQVADAVGGLNAHVLLILDDGADIGRRSLRSRAVYSATAESFLALAFYENGMLLVAAQSGALEIDPSAVDCARHTAAVFRFLAEAGDQALEVVRHTLALQREFAE